jgi:hypothetical protein
MSNTSRIHIDNDLLLPQDTPPFGLSIEKKILSYTLTLAYGERRLSIET